MDRTRRAAGRLPGRCGEQDGGAVVALGQLAGDNANDPGRPFGVREDQNRAFQQARVAFDLFLRRAQHLAGEHAPAGIQAFQVGCQHAGAAHILGSEQFHGRVGVFQAA